MKNKHAEMIKELSDRELVFHLYLTQIILLTIAVILGMILFDDVGEFTQLFNWEDRNILLIGGGAGLVVVLLDFTLMKILPSSYYDDGGLNERIFRNRSISHIALMAAMISISEEILFRGIIQTNVGLVFASIIFAVIHYRYLFNWFLFLNIILLSFFIGYLYEVTGNLVVTIFMHFIIDFLLGVLIKYRNNKQEGMFNE
ncbi:membrane protease YdiL (CAAX protease family) [Cytobacillus eiseniae]|uniref:Membrane protease YdiL (CAAX protease family) n=1 Tax=Cytobacillus eiseniae TaxID=762947 RepID=A0ABS4RCU8_9BACI|nr:type II CAAX endopeptidase family protein [Cytobacillus eiseniae]MBP2240712.1 membrane protease YdiL (CAAX protease family) [Cytobacillus eiseniae]